MISAAQSLALVRIAFGAFMILSALSKTTQGWLTNADGYHLFARQPGQFVAVGAPSPKPPLMSS